MNTPQPAVRSSLAICLAAVAIAVSGTAPAQSNSQPVPETPVVLAQATASTSARVTAEGPNASPPQQRGVRAAAAEGTEALRRYVNRTRMIYAFYYNDFAPRD